MCAARAGASARGRVGPTLAESIGEGRCSAKTLPHGRGSVHRVAMNRAPRVSTGFGCGVIGRVRRGQARGLDDRNRAPRVSTGLGCGVVGRVGARASAPDSCRIDRRRPVFGEDPPLRSGLGSSRCDEPSPTRQHGVWMWSDRVCAARAGASVRLSPNRSAKTGVRRRPSLTVGARIIQRDNRVGREARAPANVRSRPDLRAVPRRTPEVRA